MLPVIAIIIFLPESILGPLLDTVPQPLIRDLIVGYLLKSDCQRFFVDHSELGSFDLGQLMPLDAVEIVVDLPSSFSGEDGQREAAVDLREEFVYIRIHFSPPLRCVAAGYR